MKSSRLLSSVLRSLGGDPELVQPDIGEDVIPVYVVDDLRFAAANRGSTRLQTHLIPGAAAAQFSGAEFAAGAGGFWLRILAPVAGAGNLSVRIDSASALSAFAVNDNLALISANVSLPEDCPFNPAVGGWVLANLDPTNGAQFLNVPYLKALQVGRIGGAAPVGVFMPGGGPVLTDVWVPPYNTLRIFANTANTVISVALSLEFPAEVSGFTS